MDDQILSERIKACCQEYGLRVTKQRIEVYRVLLMTEEHPDVETVYKRVRLRFPSISLDTVYRTLRTLESVGLITRVGGPVERFRFDANRDLHHHFVCSHCGSVRDFYDEQLDKVATSVSVRHLGEALSVRAEVSGICNVCRAAGADLRR